MNRVEIVATGPEFVRWGVRGIESVMEEMITNARNEIHVIAYLVTSSAMPILRLLAEKAKQGIRVNLIINSLEELEKEIKDYLFMIQRNFSKVFQMVSFRDAIKRDIHAKILIVDRQKALIGSANLSWGGIAGNYEMGVLIEGEIAWHIAKLIEFILHRSNKII